MCRGTDAVPVPRTGPEVVTAPFETGPEALEHVSFGTAAARIVLNRLAGVPTTSLPPASWRRSRGFVLALSAFVLLAASCGGTDTPTASSDGPPTVLVTTSIWADVVSNVACDPAEVEVETVMPIGADAHSFEPSLADRASFDGASLIVANGIQLEVGLLDTIAGAEDAGTPVVRLGRHVDTIPYVGGGHSHDDDDHDDDHDHHRAREAHYHEDDDPHFWFDPTRVSAILPVLADRLVDDVGLDRDAVEECVERYRDELTALDADIAARVDGLPVERRLLVTNHDTLGYFADRYDLEVIGTVSTSPSGLGETNPADLEALAQVMESAGSRTIFADASASVDEAEALARRLGDAEVVTLFTESLSEPGAEADTYARLLATNADRILDALS